MHLACVVGARPNFMKMAPILRALEAYPKVKTTLVHTGQHYDRNLSDVFFEELEIRKPDVFLGIGSGTHAQQTSEVMKAIEQLLMAARNERSAVDRLVVVGDVNSTMAAAIAAVKLNTPVAHVEAGLRSFDRSMPEEINRLLTDSISDLLLVSEPQGIDNLRKEGHSDHEMFLVGNVMIDTLFAQRDRAVQRDTLQQLNLRPREYGVVTLHRPANVDQPSTLSDLLVVLKRISQKLPLVFPVHPRTKGRIEQLGIIDEREEHRGIRFCEPLGYLDFLCLTSQAKVIVTDSGGLQEESTALEVPCLTMRENTERPITCSVGTSTLIGNSHEKLEYYLSQVLSGTYKAGRRPELWDGKAAERIAKILAS
jgi:UDP-N-acetylglucosamine 2-epimerase (non-hydrolysing)